MIMEREPSMMMRDFINPYNLISFPLNSCIGLYKYLGFLFVGEDMVTSSTGKDLFLESKLRLNSSVMNAFKSTKSAGEAVAVADATPKRFLPTLGLVSVMDAERASLNG